MKWKTRDFVLCAIVLISLILLIPSFRALAKPTILHMPQYMSLLGVFISIAINKGREIYS